MSDEDHDREDALANADHHDPHKDGACCHACGFAAELERSGIAPPVKGKPIEFPIDESGVPHGAALVVRQAKKAYDEDVHDVTRAEVQIGRTADNDVVLAASMISRRQMRLVFRDGGAYLADAKSGCGTFVNGQRIGGPVRLCEGDKIFAGDFTIELIRIP